MTHIISIQNSLVRTGYTFHQEDRKNKSTWRLEGRKPEKVANSPSDYDNTFENHRLAWRDG